MDEETNGENQTFAMMDEPILIDRLYPTVEAIQFSGGHENVAAIEKFFGGPRRVKTKHTTITRRTSEEGSIVENLELEFEMEPFMHIGMTRGDWLVRVRIFGEYHMQTLSDLHFRQEFKIDSARKQ